MTTNSKKDVVMDDKTMERSMERYHSLLKASADLPDSFNLIADELQAAVVRLLAIIESLGPVLNRTREFRCAYTQEIYQLNIASKTFVDTFTNSKIESAISQVNELMDTAVRFQALKEEGCFDLLRSLLPK